MSNSVLSFIIKAKDEASAIVNNLKQNMGGIGGVLAKFAAGFGVAFGVRELASFTKEIIDYGGQIKDAADATGLSTDKFQALSIAAKQNGVDMGQLTGALGRVRNLQSSIGSEKGVQDTFRRIGMSVADVQGADPAGLLEKIAKGVKDTGDASVAFDAFGRGAAGLLSTLNELADGWDPLVAKMRSGIISQADIEMLDRAGDEMGMLGTRAKVAGADVIGTWSSLTSTLGNMLGRGQGFIAAVDQTLADQDAGAKQKTEQMKQREEARKLSERLAAEDKAKSDLATATKESAGLSDQMASKTLSAKEYALKLEERAVNLARSANEDGLTALERQTRMNEALKANLALIDQQAKVKAEEARESEQRRSAENAEASARRSRLVEESQQKYKTRFDKMTPEQQLAQVNANIGRWQGVVNGADTEQKKLDATKSLNAQLAERERITKAIADRDAGRAGKEQSLMQRDRDLRESRMTPEQQAAESRKRQAEIEKQLGGETDPEKRLELRSKLMDEAERQAGLTVQKTGRQSMSIADVFEKGYGQRGKKDPAQEQVELSKDIKKLLEKIEKKPGGMAP